jgi:hypothetical protein
MARAAGYPDAEIRRLLRGGAWVVLRRGVYVEASVLAAAGERRHAVHVAGLLLVLGFDAVAGGPSAARIWGIETLRAPAGGIVVVTDDRTVPTRRRAGYTVRAAELPPHHRTLRYGVPVTSAARTAIDLARSAPFIDGVVAVDSVLRAGTASLEQLREVLELCSPWRGGGRARRVVEFADPASESVLESVSRVAMAEQGVPTPRTQVVVGDQLGSFARVDFLWDGYGVIGEADGLAKYEPDGVRTVREIVRAEKRREERLMDAGFEVLRWGWADARNPPRLAHRLRAAFARGAERRGGHAAG